jgi:hypothetical protein
MYRPSGSGRDMYLAEKYCRTHPHYHSTNVSSVASVTRMNISKVLPSGSGRDIYLVSSPPRDTIRDANRNVDSKKKIHSKGLFTQSIFDVKERKRPQSAMTYQKAKEKKEAQTKYMSELATTTKKKKKTRPVSALKNSPGKKPRKGQLLQRQKFKDATTGRFKGAYFGGLRYDGSVSHSLTWK